MNEQQPYDKPGGPPGNKKALKHGAYGLKKRVETGLTTKNDYKRYTTLLDRWGLSPAEVEAMGMVGSTIELKAWQFLIAEDATGAYLFVKDNAPDEIETIIRLGRNASYQTDRATKDLLALADRLQSDRALDYEDILANE
jgi:hypothetical protein